MVANVLNTVASASAFVKEDSESSLEGVYKKLVPQGGKRKTRSVGEGISCTLLVPARIHEK